MRVQGSRYNRWFWLTFCLNDKIDINVLTCFGWFWWVRLLLIFFGRWAFSRRFWWLWRWRLRGHGCISFFLAFLADGFGFPRSLVLCFCLRWFRPYITVFLQFFSLIAILLDIVLQPLHNLTEVLHFSISIRIDDFLIFAPAVRFGLARNDAIDEWSFWLDELLYAFLDLDQD